MAELKREEKVDLPKQYYVNLQYWQRTRSVEIHAKLMEERDSVIFSDTEIESFTTLSTRHYDTIEDMTRNAVGKSIKIIKDRIDSEEALEELDFEISFD
jgi:hypothetical protein